MIQKLETEIKKISVSKSKLTLLFLLFQILIFSIAPATAQLIKSPKLPQKTADDFSFDGFESNQSFTSVAVEIIPTVVSIYSTKIVTSSELWEKNIVDDELKDFFGEKYYSFFPPQEITQKGSGSGIIVTPDGFILTNLHVIENAETITVILSDNRTYQAEIAGTDPLSELAVIKINENNLPAARFGNSDSVKIGEWVLAVGNPLELKSTVTAGIVSAIGREIDIIDDNFGVENFIQTDATINPGSSGGALVNTKGEVIGINTAIATQSGYNQGYGFAIPINLARQIMGDLIAHGYVVRSYLGLSMQDVDEKIARALKMPNPYGVFVDFVNEDSPAWLAGLREKDVLIELDNRIVNQGNVVQSQIAQKKPGDDISLTVLRRGKIYRVRVKLGERPPAKVNKNSIAKNPKTFSGLGLKVQNLSRRMTEELGLRSGEGIIVSEIEQGSPAFEANIHLNDVILEINDQKVTSLFLYENILSAAQKGDVLILKIKRQGNIFHRFVEVN